MNIQFPESYAATAPEANGAGLSLPRAVLERHGARVLSPADALQLAGRPELGSTVYRSRVLLVPNRMVNEGITPQDSFLVGVLDEAGLAVDVPPPLQTNPIFNRYEPDSAENSALPRRVMLRAAPGRGPVRVDAWTALQALRSTHRDGGRADDVALISLEHLLVGSAIVGAPGATEGSSTDDEGVLSYARPGGGGRMPVAYLPAPPAERALPGRRPVVAVLDTGVGPNRWLGLPGRGNPLDPAGYVRIDQEIQEAVLAEEMHKLSGSSAIELISNHWDQPVSPRPLVGELDSHTGHGTFIAGIIRQWAPDARVLAIRVMHSDGIVYEGDLRQALHLLALRAGLARKAGLADDPGMVDVVSLSLGYYHEEPLDEHITIGLEAEIRALTAQGVLVVTAAGNHASDRPFYPAALTDRGMPRLFAVGALNPNGSTALFSNAGPWVNCLAPGAAVVSTFPEIRGAREPAIKVGPRETIDGDDFHSGFASWSGTSFAAPLLAAQLAQAMADDAVAAGRAGSGTGLDALDTATTISRAEKAVSDVRAKFAVRPPDDDKS
jgi:subtilisin family serine protease